MKVYSSVSNPNFIGFRYYWNDILIFENLYVYNIITVQIEKITPKKI